MRTFADTFCWSRVAVLATLSLFFVLLTLPAAAEERPVHSPTSANRTGFTGGCWDTGAAFVSGQPTEEALRQLIKDGVMTVVSVRTKAEMDNRQEVPFDEVALLKKLGIPYINIEMGACTPEKLRQFQDAMAASKGKVLLHCTVGWRATYMWMAYLVADRKASIDEAWKAGMNMSVTVDRSGLMLDREVSYMSHPREEGARTPKAGEISKPGSKLKITAPKVINPPTTAWDSFTMWDLGSILNCSQPNEQKLRELAAQGVKTVVNLRGPSEMDDLKAKGFDEEAVAKELGLKYVSVPITSWQTFTPEALAKVAEAFEGSEGKILFHCQSANRTTQVLVPYLVKYQGMTLDEATKVGESMRWSNMLKELLGVDFTYSSKPKTKTGG